MTFQFNIHEWNCSRISDLVIYWWFEWHARRPQNSNWKGVNNHIDGTGTHTHTNSEKVYIICNLIIERKNNNHCNNINNYENNSKRYRHQHLFTFLTFVVRYFHWLADTWMPMCVCLHFTVALNSKRHTLNRNAVIF